MLLYCLKCKRIKDSKNPKIIKTKNERVMVLLSCLVWNSKKSRFIKEQKGSGLWSSFLLAISNFISNFISTFLLAGDKFMPDMH